MLTDDELALVLEDLAQSLPLPEDITAQSLAGLDPAELTRVLLERCVAEFEGDPGLFHSVLMREFERQVVLGSVDSPLGRAPDRYGRPPGRDRPARLRSA